MLMMDGILPGFVPRNIETIHAQELAVAAVIQ